MKHLIFIVLILFPFICFSQVNMESQRSDKKGFSGNNTLGIDLFKGNVEVLTYNLGLRIDHKKGIHYTFLQALHEYGEENGIEFQDVGFGHLRWTAMWFNRIGSELFTQFQYDDFKLLRLRQLNGLGVRIVPHKILAIGVGAMSDYEKLEDNNTDLIPRSTNYINISKSINDKAKLSLVTYYQPSLVDMTDYRILVESNLEFSMNKRFSLINAFIYAYDTRPPENVLKDDMKINVSFKINWGLK